MRIARIKNHAKSDLGIFPNWYKCGRFLRIIRDSGAILSAFGIIFIYFELILFRIEINHFRLKISPLRWDFSSVYRVCACKV